MRLTAIKRNTHLLLTALLATLICAQWAQASTFHSLDEIRNTAKAHVEKNIGEVKYKTEIKTGYLDPRLRLTKCASPLHSKELQNNGRQANTTVIISCKDAKPWTVYVPVKIKQYTLAVVATAPLGRGQPIRAENLKLVEKELSSITKGYYVDTKVLVGRLPRRPLARGSILSPSDLAANKVISRGQRVTIIADGQGLSIRAPGKAMSDASQGEAIKVENISSRRTVEGIATAPGIVRIPM